MFTRVILASLNELAVQSSAQLRDSLQVLWEQGRTDQREAFGEAVIHDFLMNDIAEVSWPPIDAADPAYWCVFSTDDKDDALEAYGWATGQGEESYTFVAYGRENGEDHYRVVFATLCENDSVMMKMRFG